MLKLSNLRHKKKIEIFLDFYPNVSYVIGMNKIKELIDQINNAERLGLSVGEVTSAKKELQLEFASLHFDVDQALRFDPFEEEAEVDEFIDLEA